MRKKGNIHIYIDYKDIYIYRLDICLYKQYIYKYLYNIYINKGKPGNPIEFRATNLGNYSGAVSPHASTKVKLDGTLTPYKIMFMLIKSFNFQGSMQLALSAGFSFREAPACSPKLHIAPEKFIYLKRKGSSSNHHDSGTMSYINFRSIALQGDVLIPRISYQNYTPEV